MSATSADTNKVWDKWHAEQDCTITAESGWLFKNCREFEKEAKAFESEVKVVCDGLRANGKLQFHLMELELTKGKTITIWARGIDAHEAVDRLVEVHRQMK